MNMSIQPVGTRSQAAGDEADLADAPLDAAAFGALYDRYLPKIYAYIGRRVEERSVAEEITARTFERALVAARRRDLPDALLGVFLYRVAANAVVDRARRARRPIPPDVRASDVDKEDDRIQAEAISDEAAARAFGSAVDGEYLRRALVRLPEVDRRVLLLSYFDGLEPDELAAALGCNLAEVALKLHRALRVLRAAVAEEASNAR
jgi:RNA polymerase sigma-70 factor (ECF subfamily)